MTRWWLLIPAALVEVGWAVSLKYADSPGMWLLVVVLVAISLTLAIQASKVLPASTVYTLFVGLGTTGTVAVDMLFLDAPFRWATIALIALLLTGIVGLKVVSSRDGED
ncbi:DMT family transporter [Phytohalomonas tamaricis]|uniref:DMT family transporter n=1 Tax=Phytohalomonas tamaricis TaxID=2081032 RepID=UPI000D0B0BF0|nr:SMR family transporter [Phytohalomonas tamaricis]